MEKFLGVVLAEAIYYTGYIQYMYCMPSNDYRNVSIPLAIHSALVDIVEAEDSLYTSVSDLVKEALREKIIQIRSQTVVPSKRGEGK